MTQTIFDPLRKKHVALTPEEQVRQHLINWLHKERNYPLQLMASEYSLKFNNKTFRCDIIAFDSTLQPILIVECKAPSVPLTQKVIEQITTYNTILRVKNLVISNGNTTFACCFNNSTEKYEYVEDVPFYSSR